MNFQCARPLFLPQLVREVSMAKRKRKKAKKNQEKPEKKKELC